MAELYYHEAEVLELSHLEGRVVLKLTAVATHDGLVSVTILINQVSTIKIDGKETATLSSERGDGEVLCLDVLPNGVNFILRWEAYSPRSSVTRSYLVEGERVEVLVN